MDSYVEVETEQPGVRAEETLTNRTTIKAMVAAFQEAEAVVRASFAAIHQAEARVNAIFALGGRHAVQVRSSRYSNADNFDRPDEAIEEMARNAWSCIVDRLELRRVMSDGDWKALEELLQRGKLPPITEEAVASFVQRYATDLPGIFRTKVTEVFEWIRPRIDTPRAAYKTNQKNARFEIGRRIVLTGLVEQSFSGGFAVRYWSAQKITALDSVFCALDGQGWGARTHYGDLRDAIEREKSGVGETPYFRFRCFKNGNLHLEFKRLDLLAKFNQIAGGANLRPHEEAP